MRTIVFKKKEYGTDPVGVGDILRIRRGNKWYTAIATSDMGTAECEGCLFDRYVTCNVPCVRGSTTTLCLNAGCIFKELSEVLENI